MKKYIKGEHNILITVSGRKSSPRPKGCKISLTFSTVEMIPPAIYLTNLFCVFTSSNNGLTEGADTYPAKTDRFGTQRFPGEKLKQGRNTKK